MIRNDAVVWRPSETSFHRKLPESTMHSLWSSEPYKPFGLDKCSRTSSYASDGSGKEPGNSCIGRSAIGPPSKGQQAVQAPASSIANWLESSKIHENENPFRPRSPESVYSLDYQAGIPQSATDDLPKPTQDRMPEKQTALRARKPRGQKPAEIKPQEVASDSARSNNWSGIKDNLELKQTGISPALLPGIRGMARELNGHFAGQTSESVSAGNAALIHANSKAKPPPIEKPYMSPDVDDFSDPEEWKGQIALGTREGNLVDLSEAPQERKEEKSELDSRIFRSTMNQQKPNAGGYNKGGLAWLHEFESRAREILQVARLCRGKLEFQVTFGRLLIDSQGPTQGRRRPFMPEEWFKIFPSKENERVDTKFTERHV